MKLIILLTLVLMITYSECYSSRKYLMRKYHLNNKQRLRIIAEILEKSDDEIEDPTELQSVQFVKKGTDLKKLPGRVETVKNFQHGILGTRQIKYDYSHFQRPEYAEKDATKSNKHKHHRHHDEDDDEQNNKSAIKWEWDGVHYLKDDEKFQNKIQYEGVDFKDDIKGAETETIDLNSLQQEEQKSPYSSIYNEDPLFQQIQQQQQDDQKEETQQKEEQSYEQNDADEQQQNQSQADVQKLNETQNDQDQNNYNSQENDQKEQDDSQNKENQEETQNIKKIKKSIEKTHLSDQDKEILKKNAKMFLKNKQQASKRLKIQ